LRQFFPRVRKNRLLDTSEIPAAEFKEEFRRFGIYAISETIGIDRSVFSAFGDKCSIGLTEEGPSALASGTRSSRAAGKLGRDLLLVSRRNIVHARRPMIIRHRRAICERCCLITQLRMAIGAI
jgi:hypothetical protein